MSLFAIADTHLSLGSDKPMDIFPGWDGYISRLEANWRRLVSPEDTVVIAGDVSWAMLLEHTAEDFSFLNALPGRKLLFKGNHDYWWTTRRKMDTYLAERGFDTLRIVHNSAEVAGEYAVCGTRGWMPDSASEEDRKVLAREAGRLNLSIDAAEKTGRKPVVFLHYPPFCGDAVCEDIVEVLVTRGIRRCYYGHLHGPGVSRIAPREIGGVTMTLVSCDAVGFMPVAVR